MNVKKIVSLIAVICVAASIAVPAFADAPSGVALKGAPVIDGQIDAEWNLCEIYPIDRLKDGDDTALKSQFRVMWSEKAIYALIEVFDTDHSFDGGPSVGDGMEIYFDLKNLKTDGFEDEDQAYFAMCAEDPSDIAYDGGEDGKANLEDSGVTVAMTTTDASYVYEAEVKLDAFTTTLAKGMTIGFDIQVNDQVSGDSARTGAYGWSDDTNNAWQGTSAYGNVTLDEAAVEVPAETEAPAPAETEAPAPAETAAPAAETAAPAPAAETAAPVAAAAPAAAAPAAQTGDIASVAVIAAVAALGAAVVIGRKH